MENPIHALRSPASCITPHTAAPGVRGRDDSPADLRDAVALSDVWSVFEQALQEAPAAQPVLVLATSHSARLPPDLLRWFDHPQVSGNRGPNVVTDVTTASVALVLAYVMQSHVSGPSCAVRGVPPVYISALCS